MNELVDMGTVIEALNECDELRYIEMERTHYTDRQKDLEILLTKCKRLLSFVERIDNIEMFERMINFVDKVRQAKYRGDDIRDLFHEFEKIQKIIKKTSKSFKNLSHATLMMG